jgi:CBS domain-containing protein
MQLDLVYTWAWIRHSIETAESLDALRLTQERMTGVAERWAARGMPTLEIYDYLNLWHDLLMRRALDFTLQELEQKGLGKPAAPFCWLLLGSGGRREQTLHPDQDNALVYRSVAKDEHGRTQERAFFLKLGELGVTTLEQIGYPFCAGFVMAANERWNGSVEHWHDQLQQYADFPDWSNSRFLMMAADLRPLYGEAALAEELRSWFHQHLPQLAFLKWQVADHGLDHKVGLDFWDRFRTELWGEHERELNIKDGGYLQLVNATRLWAVAHGIPETNTGGRIAHLVDKNLWREEDGTNIRAAYETLLHLRLWNNYARPDALLEREREGLKTALRTIRALQKRTAKGFAKPK